MKKSAVSKYHAVPAVEMHRSLWLDDMRNLKVSDFMRGGIMTIDPYVLNGPKETLDRLNNKIWNIVYLTENFANRGHTLQDYIYLVDTENGLEIVHYEPVIKTDNTNKPENLERASL